MWEDVGIVRNEAGLARAARRLAQLNDQLNATGMASDDRAFNLTWHDWLNLSNLILVGRAIQSAATERRESRGAHFREDFPERGPLEKSSYVTVRLKDGTADQIELGEQLVKFSIIRPGESLLKR
jgi:fumarate reductase flavoprotein subunit